MKIPLIITLILGTGVLWSAEMPFETKALISEKNGPAREIRLLAAEGGNLRFREGNSSAVIETHIAEGSTLFIPEPPEFTAAMILYQARKFNEAKTAFATVKQRFSPLISLKNNPATMAAFYEMECLRRLGDLDGLAKSLQVFSKEPLTNESQLRQIEVDLLWDAVRTKSWELLERLTKERWPARLPDEQRVQVAWCRALALDNLGRSEESLVFYQTAITADAAASVELARPAALRILAIHKANPAVQAAIKSWGSKDEDLHSKGRAALVDAAAIATFYHKMLGSSVRLPTEYVDFLKYQTPAPQ